MGYVLTTSPDQSLARPLASPKTHTPLSRVEERGLRFYSPEVGRWCSREPIGEAGERCLYLFLKNNANSYLEYLGLVAVNGWELLDLLADGELSDIADKLKDFDPAKDTIEFGNPEAQSIDKLFMLGALAVSGLENKGYEEAAADFGFWLDPKKGKKSDFQKVMKTWSNDKEFLKGHFDVVREILKTKCEDIKGWESYGPLDTDKMSRQIFLYLGGYTIKFKSAKTSGTTVKATIKVDDKYDFSVGATADINIGKVTVVIPDAVWLVLKKAGYGKDFDRVAEWDEELTCCSQSGSGAAK
jgi:RHS repeat-associated protein